jgi:ubiquinol-cytochrome c reductase cytochrome b subunit
MPAYGNALNPAETTALVHFLLTLRGGNLTPAIDASRQMVQSSEQPPPPSRPTTPGER